MAATLATAVKKACDSWVVCRKYNFLTRGTEILDNTFSRCGQGLSATTRDATMRTHGYSAAELAGFYAVLNRAVCEANERDLKISVPTLVQRLFQAANAGERDPDALVLIILGLHASSRRAKAA